MVQCVAVCCSAVKCVAMSLSRSHLFGGVAVCASVLQSDGILLEEDGPYLGGLQCVAVRCSVLQCIAVCCSVLQCVAACCRVGASFVMGHVLVCCSVLQHVAVSLCVVAV